MRKRATTAVSELQQKQRKLFELQGQVHRAKGLLNYVLSHHGTVCTKEMQIRLRAAEDQCWLVFKEAQYEMQNLRSEDSKLL